MGALASAYACNVYTEDLLGDGPRDTSTGGEETGGEETGGQAIGGWVTGGRATGGEETGGSPGGRAPEGGTAGADISAGGSGATGGDTGGRPPNGGAGAVAGQGSGGEAESGGTTGSGGQAGAAMGGTGGGPTGGTGGVALGECGDGTTDPGEDCDDEGESATCDADCTDAECGDGVTNTSADEECDDGGESEDCNDDCTAADCGDGVRNRTAGEDCDDGGESATCDDDCTAVECGDDVVNTHAGEECEPGSESDCTTDDCTYTYWHYLVNRYSFGGTGTTAVDSVGSADGTIRNASLTGTGKLALAGGTTDQYVDLPNGIVSSLTNATIEAWFNWSAPADRNDTSLWWQRIFDFGSSSAGEGNQGDGVTYLFLSPDAWEGNARVAFTGDGKDNESSLIEVPALAAGVDRHVAVVVDDAHDTITLYVQGVSVGSDTFTDHLSDLDDVNNWIGRSQFSLDVEFKGSIDEFRIYDVALSASQVKDSFEAGPNP